MTIPEALAEQQKIADGADGFVHFCRNYCFIEDKATHDAIKFDLYPAQEAIARQFVECGSNFWILKARQLGITWLVVAYALWRVICTPHFLVFVMNQSDPYAIAFLVKVRFMLKRLPDWLRPTPSQDNKNEIEFDTANWGCAIKAVAATEKSARSATADLVIFDEASFIEYLAEARQAAEPSLEHSKGQIIGLSTSNGPAGEFYEVWKNCPQNGYKPIFLSWRDHPRRNDEWYAAEAAKHTANPMFMAQEYPATPEEAFAAGPNRLYPQFSVSRHVGEIAIDPTWPKYRAVDWGWSGDHLFVCLWIAHDPVGMPGLKISPACPRLTVGLQAVMRDPKTGRPIDENDHECLTGDTEVFVQGIGWTPIADMVGTRGRCWTPIGWCPFSNVHLVGVRMVYRLEFDDGSRIDATEDHEILVGDRFASVASIAVSDTIRAYGPDHQIIDVADLQRQSFSPSSRGEVLLKRAEATASCGVGVSQWPDSEGLSCPPHRQQPIEQCDFESNNPAEVRASIAAFLYSGGEGKVSPQRSDVCGAGSTRVASIGRRAGVAPTTWSGSNRRSPISRIQVHRLWNDVQEPNNPEEAASILSPELQNEGVSRQTAGLKVVRKCCIGWHPVFDLTVERAHCLTLKNGVVVSNCDALRYVVATMGLNGLVYVYREMVVSMAGTLGASAMARRIHEMSGWTFPANADPHDIAKYEHGAKGEIYAGGVADSRGGGWIKQFNDWGVKLVPAMAPDAKRFGLSVSRGEVEDGIAALSVLIAGDALVRSPNPPTMQEWAKNMLKRPPYERPHVMTQEQEHALIEANSNPTGSAIYEPDHHF